METVAKRGLELHLGRRYTAVMPYSEVCLHMQVAGTRMELEIVPQGSRFFMVQLFSRNDGRAYSSPITLGEAGVSRDLDWPSMTDFWKEAAAFFGKNRDVAEYTPESAGPGVVTREQLWAQHGKFWFQSGASAEEVLPLKTITIRVHGVMAMESASIETKARLGDVDAVRVLNSPRGGEQGPDTVAKAAYHAVRTAANLPFSREDVYDPTTTNGITDFLSSMANIMCDQARDEAIKKLLREHRTIQQSLAGVCLAFLSGMAEKQKTRDFDGRNEFAVERAAVAVKAWGESYTCHSVPCI